MTYQVTVCRQLYAWRTVEIEAPNERTALKLACEAVDGDRVADASWTIGAELGPITGDPEIEEEDT